MSAGAFCQASATGSHCSGLISSEGICMSETMGGTGVAVPVLFPSRGTASAARCRAPCRDVNTHNIGGLTTGVVLTLFPPGRPFFGLRLKSVTGRRMTRRKSSSTVAGVSGLVKTVRHRLVSCVRAGHYHVAVDRNILRLVITNGYLLCLPPRANNVGLCHLGGCIIIQSNANG